MVVIENFFKIIPAGMLMFIGWRSLVEGMFPPTVKEDPDFYRQSVEVNGKEVWADMMRPETARLLSIVTGAAMLIGGLLWFLYMLKLWPFQPGNSSEF